MPLSILWSSRIFSCKSKQHSLVLHFEMDDYGNLSFVFPQIHTPLEQEVMDNSMFLVNQVR